MTTITAIAPEIGQYFNKALLENNIWDSIHRSIQRHTEKAHRKYREGTGKRKEYDLLLKGYEELYEWKKAQKAYQSAENKEGLQKPVVPVEAIYSFRGEVGEVVRSSFKSADLLSSSRENNGL